MSNTSRVFARGELRILSAALIEANRDKTISEVAALHVSEFGFYEFKVAVIHIRWMLREGLITNASELMERWSRKSEKVKAPAPVTEAEAEAPAAVTTKPKRVRPSRAKKAKTEVAEATEESNETLAADVEAIAEVMETEAA